jgi:sugar-phosphatase
VVRLPFEGVVFDCDGVLVDSAAAVDLAWRRLCAELELPVEEVLPTIHGVRAVDTLSRWIPAERLATAVARLEDLEVATAQTVPPVLGALELVHLLDGGRWGVATSGSRRLATARLEAAGIGVPSVLVTADDVARGKPHPDPYVEAARRLGVPPPAVVVFEDSPSGATSARAAGARVVAVATTHPVGAFVAEATIADLRGVRVAPGALVLDG